MEYACASCARERHADGRRPRIEFERLSRSRHRPPTHSPALQAARRRLQICEDTVKQLFSQAGVQDETAFRARIATHRRRTALTQTIRTCETALQRSVAKRSVGRCHPTRTQRGKRRGMAASIGAIGGRGFQPRVVARRHHAAAPPARRRYFSRDGRVGRSSCVGGRAIRPGGRSAFDGPRIANSCGGRCAARRCPASRRTRVSTAGPPPRIGGVVRHHILALRAAGTLGRSAGAPRAGCQEWMDACEPTESGNR